MMSSLGKTEEHMVIQVRISAWAHFVVLIETGRLMESLKSIPDANFTLRLTYSLRKTTVYTLMQLIQNDPS